MMKKEVIYFLQPASRQPKVFWRTSTQHRTKMSFTQWWSVVIIVVNGERSFESGQWSLFTKYQNDNFSLELFASSRGNVKKSFFMQFAFALQFNNILFNSASATVAGHFLRKNVYVYSLSFCWYLYMALWGRWSKLNWDWDGFLNKLLLF